MALGTRRRRNSLLFEQNPQPDEAFCCWVDVSKELEQLPELPIGVQRNCGKIRVWNIKHNINLWFGGCPGSHTRNRNRQYREEATRPEPNSTKWTCPKRLSSLRCQDIGGILRDHFL